MMWKPSEAEKCIDNQKGLLDKHKMEWSFSDNEDSIAFYLNLFVGIKMEYRKLSILEMRLAEDVADIEGVVFIPMINSYRVCVEIKDISEDGIEGVVHQLSEAVKRFDESLTNLSQLAMFGNVWQCIS